MTRPLTLLLYQKLIPGGQLVNRLQDLGYRVQPVADPAALVEEAERGKPLLIIADVEPRHPPACAAIVQLRQNPATRHIPVIALAAPDNGPAQEAARAAGATLVVHDNAILPHLNQFLEQALQVD